MRDFRQNIFRIILASLVVVKLASCGHSQINQPSQIKKKIDVDSKPKNITPSKTVQPQNASQPRNKLQAFYTRWQGTPYQYGGLTSKGIDCSGFVYLAYKNVFNYPLPRMTRHQLRLGRRIEKNELQFGDLVFFKTSKKVWHVGIYTSNERFVHASTSKGVITSHLQNPYWKSKYRVARRIEF